MLSSLECGLSFFIQYDLYTYKYILVYGFVVYHFYSSTINLMTVFFSFWRVTVRGVWLSCLLLTSNYSTPLPPLITASLAQGRQLILILVLWHDLRQASLGDIMILGGSAYSLIKHNAISCPKWTKVSRWVCSPLMPVYNNPKSRSHRLLTHIFHLW